MQSMLEKPQETTISGLYFKKQITYLQCMKECLNKVDCDRKSCKYISSYDDIKTIRGRRYHRSNYETTKVIQFYFFHNYLH